MRQAGYPYLIVGVTGNVLEDDIIEYLQAGADMVLGKPLQAASLTLLLNHIQTNGAESIHDMKLIETSKNLEWVPKLG